MSHTVLLFDEMNANRRKYSVNHTRFPVEGPVFADAGNLVQDMIGSFKNMRVEGNNLVCDIDLFPTPAVSTVSLLGDGFSYVSAGTGNIDQDGNVTDFELTSVFPTNDPAWKKS